MATGQAAAGPVKWCGTRPARRPLDGRLARAVDRLDGDLVITASEVSSRGAYLLSPQLLYGRLALTWGHVAACFTKRVKQS